MTPIVAQALELGLSSRTGTARASGSEHAGACRSSSAPWSSSASRVVDVASRAHQRRDSALQGLEGRRAPPRSAPRGARGPARRRSGGSTPRRSTMRRRRRGARSGGRTAAGGRPASDVERLADKIAARAVEHTAQRQIGHVSSCTSRPSSSFASESGAESSTEACPSSASSPLRRRLAPARRGARRTRGDYVIDQAAEEDGEGGENGGGAAPSNHFILSKMKSITPGLSL